MARCPSCGSPLDGDEQFCLQCGRRLVPEPDPRPSFAVPTVIVGAIALVAVGGVLFALEQVESDAEKSATKRVPVVTQPEAPKSDEKPTDVAAWPAGTSAYTVLLTATEGQPAARARATAAVGAGVPAGLLHSSAYPTLEPGRWVLFAGRFDTREAATEEATRYRALGFPEAEPGFVSDQREPATND